LFFYLELVGAFVVPLLTVYLMGVFTRVHRASGTIGLLVGVVYGLWRLAAVKLAAETGTVIIPPALAGAEAAYPISMGVTAVAMLAVSLAAGWAPRGELLHDEAGGWLRASQLEIRRVDQSLAVVDGGGHWPSVLGIAVLGAGLLLCFVVFW